MTRRKRRSLLNRRTPNESQRVVRPPSVLKTPVAAEDAPTAPMLVEAPPKPPRQSPQSSQVQHSNAIPTIPPDPGLVEFDLGRDELPELPGNAFEPLDEFEELDDEAIEAYVDTPAPGPRRQPAVVTGPVAATVVAPILTAFAIATCLTMFAVLIPWFAFVSPSIEASRQARAAAPQPRVVEVVRPVPVPVAAPAPVLDAVDVDVEPPVETEPTPVAVTPAPAERPEPTARPRPKVRRPRPKPAPAPEPEPTATAEPEPVVTPVPPAAKALGGRVSGTAKKEDISIVFDIRPEGELRGRVTRAGKTVAASGTWRMNVGRVAFTLTEKGNAATYRGMLSTAGVDGKVKYPKGASGKLRLRR